MIPQTEIIRLETDGFSCWERRRRWWKWTEPGLTYLLRWDQIDRIIAYKDDVFAFDQICLGFFTQPDANGYRFVHEHMEGWNELTNRLDERCQIGHQWYFEVMFPAFERCEKTLWTRSVPRVTL